MGRRKHIQSLKVGLDHPAAKAAARKHFLKKLKRCNKNPVMADHKHLQTDACCQYTAASKTSQDNT
jgi:hypothetical protein